MAFWGMFFGSVTGSSKRKLLKNGGRTAAIQQKSSEIVC